MKKTTILLGILAICLMSFGSYANYVNAHCFGNYKIDDPTFSGGDYYHVALEVASLYPTDGGFDLGQNNVGPGTYTLPSNAVVQNVWYQAPPTSADYYTLTIYVYKYDSGGNLLERASGYSYGGMTIVGGFYILTANNLISISL